MASEIRDGDRDAAGSLLTADDPPSVRIVNPAGASPFLLIGDHAGNRIPARLGSLGVSEADLARHIGWDIGVGALGAALAASLDAPFLRQIYSRLVVDCNRAPEAVDAMPEASDGTAIPGNAALTEGMRAARLRAIYEPYHAAIADELARRDAIGIRTILIALHSFTPWMAGVARPWQIGILHDRGDTSFALACLESLRARADLTVGDNAPYRMDSIDYTIPRHAYPARRRYVEIEIRQDLLATEAGVAEWCDILSEIFEQAG